MKIVLKALWMIIKDKSSGSEVLFDAEVKIVCFTSVSVTVNHSRVLKLFSFSSMFFVMSGEENIAVWKTEHLSEKSIAVLSLNWIDESFSVLLNFVNLYAV